MSLTLINTYYWRPPQEAKGSIRPKTTSEGGSRYVPHWQTVGEKFTLSPPFTKFLLLWFFTLYFPFQALSIQHQIHVRLRQTLWSRIQMLSDHRTPERLLNLISGENPRALLVHCLLLQVLFLPPPQTRLAGRLYLNFQEALLYHYGSI